MLRKILAFLIILIGIGIICYPTLRDKYYEYQQRKITAEWLATPTYRQCFRQEDNIPDQAPPVAIDLTKEMEGL